MRPLFAQQPALNEAVLNDGYTTMGVHFPLTINTPSLSLFHKQGAGLPRFHHLTFLFVRNTLPLRHFYDCRSMMKKTAQAASLFAIAFASLFASSQASPIVPIDNEVSAEEDLAQQVQPGTDLLSLTAAALGEALLQ
jgi:hypothetical protein